MLVILRTWSIVECLLRNLNWWFRIRFFLSMIGFSLLFRNFSKSVDITGSNEIGLYDTASCGGFPGFGIMITSATFHSLRTYFSLKAALIGLVIFTIAFLGSSCRTSPVMRSNPGAFLGFMLLFISFLTSVAVAGLISSFSGAMSSFVVTCSSSPDSRALGVLQIVGLFVHCFWPILHPFSDCGDLHDRPTKFFVAFQKE